MAQKKRLQEEVEEILQAAEELDPRLAPLAALRDQLPPGPEVDSPSQALKAAADLEAAMRRLQEEARRRRAEAEAKRAEANRLRAHLEELARRRQELQGLTRRAQALVAWTSPEEVQALTGVAAARIEALEAEMREVAVRLQELEADEGVRRLRQEEAAQKAQEEAQKAAAQKAAEARALLRQQKVAEAIRYLRRAIRQAGEETPQALTLGLEEAMAAARRQAGNALFRAREALAGGDPAKAMQEVGTVASLLRYLPAAERRPLHGIFCRAAASLAEGRPLVLVRGRRTPQGWTAAPGTLAIGTPCKGGVQVLFNLGTPWKEGSLVREEAANTAPLRAQTK